MVTVKCGAANTDAIGLRREPDVPCFPECSAWCTCVDNNCVPLPVTINALRFVASGNRFLRSTNPGQGLMVAGATATPGPAETFMVLSPGTVPLTSGSPLSLAVFTTGWTRAGSQVRVDHNVITFPPQRKTPRLVTYEVGGPSARVLDSPPFSAGYPAYPGDDPAERIFTLVKLIGGAAAPVGTPLNNGDQVALRIDSNRGNTFYFRVTGPSSGDEVHGDGMTLGQPDAVFTIVMNEVRPGMGWRPEKVNCRSCAAVTAVVTRAATGNAPIAGAAASINVQGHTYAGTTGPAGRAALAETTGNTCVPAGQVTVRVTADRYRDGAATATVPASGAIDVPVSLQCTPVSGKVVDSAGSGQPGVSVYLRDASGNLLTDANGVPFHTTTGLDGSFTFLCVQHGFVQVWTTADPSQIMHTNTIGPDGWINVTIVLQTTCGDLVGQVVDADTGLPIAGATVTESGGRVTTTDANGMYRFTCVKPAGTRTVFASAPGYTENFATGSVPTTGTSTPVVIRLTKVKVAEILIRLDWGSTPSDLDSHLSGPSLAGGRFHCLFNARNPENYISLTPDVIHSFGPETTSIIGSPDIGGDFVAGDYHFWVHDYSGPTFAGSQATVAIAVRDGQGMLSPLGTFDVSTAAGSPTDLIWRVADLAVDPSGATVVTGVQILQAGTSADVL